MKKFIGIFEAKTHFTKIISQVMEGEEVFVTRRGKPVAKIIPIEKISNMERVNAAISRIHSLAREMRLGGFNWKEFKSFRDEGRR